MSKIVFFSPYLTNKHAGGGEKHLFDTALATSELGHQVYIAISPLYQNNGLVELLGYQRFYEHFLGRKLEQLKFIRTPLMTRANFLKKLFWTKQFDQLYFVTDGSLFFSLARKNHLHIQIPLILLKKEKFIDRLKLKNWQVNTNSKFTKRVIEKNWHTRINLVHYPLVKFDEFERANRKKEKIILSVGRFFKQLHSKRQDVLVAAFKKMVDLHPKLMNGWRLVLVGTPEDEHYFAEVKKMAQGYKIEFQEQVKRRQLVRLY